MDATDVPLQVLTPGETFPAIGHDADEGPLGFVSAVWNDLVWDRGTVLPRLFLVKLGTGIGPACPRRRFCRGGTVMVRGAPARGWLPLGH